MRNDRFKFRLWNKEHRFFFPDFSVYMDGSLESEYFMLDTHDSHKGHILQQCTGIPDKDGNLIYEGDLVSLNGSRPIEIYFDGLMFRGAGNNQYIMQYADMCKILGNSLENADLFD